MSSNQPSNLHLLPSFISQDLCPDGIFLTPVSGLHYVLHVYDQSMSALAACQAPSEVKLGHVAENVRRHDDRLAYLESRHGCLSQKSSLKIAEAAEFKDWVINRSELDWLTILGLPRLASEGRREWQDAARKQVIDLFRFVLKTLRTSLNFSVLVVTNPMRGRTAGLNVIT